jgi:hypothetical protein
MAPYGDKDPAAIRRIRATLDAPPYDVPPAAGPGAMDRGAPAR